MLECEVLRQVSTLMVATKQEQGGWMAQLQSPQVNDALQKIRESIEIVMPSWQTKLLLMDRKPTKLIPIWNQIKYESIAKKIFLKCTISHLISTDLISIVIKCLLASPREILEILKSLLQIFIKVITFFWKKNYRDATT